jgi:transglutaminase-like putative cysteine protease
MSILTGHHSTVYRYRDPVELSEHPTMFRPRESYDLRLIQTNLVITPEPAQLRWLHDPFDNPVAVATFQGTTSELRLESTVTLEHFETSLPEAAAPYYCPPAPPVELIRSPACKQTELASSSRYLPLAIGGTCWPILEE